VACPPNARGVDNDDERRQPDDHDAHRPRDRDDARLRRTPRLVFDAYTRPESLKRWLGVFGGWSVAVCEVDLRVGGAYRFVWRGADGREMGMRGVYREIVPGQRIVSTETFDDPWYDGEAVGTAEFAERGGKTMLTITMRYSSQDTRDAVLRTPMQDGLSQSYDKLDELLRSAGA
jgi:uncharacterized protein YndB with AHSA1/START domain